MFEKTCAPRESNSRPPTLTFSHGVHVSFPFSHGLKREGQGADGQTAHRTEEDHAWVRPLEVLGLGHHRAHDDELTDNSRCSLAQRSPQSLCWAGLASSLKIGKHCSAGVDLALVFYFLRWGFLLSNRMFSCYFRHETLKIRSQWEGGSRTRVFVGTQHEISTATRELRGAGREVYFEEK